MKKNILKVTIVAAVTLAACLNLMQDKNSSNSSDLALSNIEALAGENSDCPNGCYSNGNGCYCNGWYGYFREAV